MEEGSEPTSALRHKRKHRVHCWELGERKLLSKSAGAGREMLLAGKWDSVLDVPSPCHPNQREGGDSAEYFRIVRA